MFTAAGSPYPTGTACSAMKAGMDSHSWGLVLDKLDRSTQQFTIIKSLLAPGTKITAGPMKGAIFHHTYDPDIVFYHGQYLVSFECVISNKMEYGIQGTSSCIAAYDPVKQELDLNHTNVVVSGKQVTSGGQNEVYSASVPQLLVFEDKLFLYWSAVAIRQRKFQRIAVEGAELSADTGGFYWVKGVGHLEYSTDAPAIEVWGPDPDNPKSNTSVDIKSLWVHKNTVIALTALGGGGVGGCAKPSGSQPGCFRMAIATSSSPLGYHIFNKALVAESRLPTNPIGYTRPIRYSRDKWSILGAFYRPIDNGYSETRPAPADWKNIAGNGVLAVISFDDPELWPTE
jgi:hypothetical protein